MVNAELNKKMYPHGTRIRLNHMGDDIHPIPDGTCGTVDHVDDLGTIFVDFDNGRYFGVVSDEDDFEKI